MSASSWNISFGETLKLRPVGGQHRLRYPQREHLTHFGQPLPRGLPRPTLPAGVPHAGQVAETQPAKVVRRAHETIKLEFKPW